MDENLTSESISAKERRKLKREDKKKLALERVALIEKLKAKPPTERESIYGSTYCQSTENEWSYYPDVGWVHQFELSGFLRNYRQCAETELWYDQTSGSLIFGSETWLGPVAAKKYEKCPYSGYLCKREAMVEVFMGQRQKAWVLKQYVESDFRKCDYSGEIHQTAAVIRVQEPTKYKYVARYYASPASGDKQVGRSCNCCNRVFEIAQVPYRSQFSDYECESCYDQRVLGTIIHPHDYSVYPSPIHTPKTIRRMVGGTSQLDGPWTFYIGRRVLKNIDDPLIRLFGVECETEIHRKSAEADGLNRTRLARAVIKTLGEDFVIIKEDGTLTANEHYGKNTGFSGFEIVTCPADIEAHRARWPRLMTLPGFTNKTTGCFRAWDEYDTCGFHVHVSRASLTDFTIGRMLDFINNKANAKFIHQVAGRGSDRFCKYIPKEPGDKTHAITDVLHPYDRVISKGEENPRNRSRRVALNLSNKNTVEFRIFRGTIHPRHIIRNIEFCNAVCNYCYPAARSYRDMADYRQFIKFVDSDRKTYPILAEWFANRKIIALKQMGERANRELVTIKPMEAVEVADGGKKEAELNGILNGIPDLSSTIAHSSMPSQPKLFEAIFSQAGSGLSYTTQPLEFTAKPIKSRQKNLVDPFYETDGVDY